MRRLTVILVAAIVGVIVMLALRGRSPGDGPLYAGDGSSAAGQLLAVGQSYSVGHVFLRNTGKEPAVIERIRILGVTDGLEYLGVRTRVIPDPDKPETFTGDFGFPPESYATKPLDEQNVVPVSKEFSDAGNPIDGLELAIGVRATRPGVARSRAVEVTYRVGKKRYREAYEGTVYLCAPVERFPGDTCPGEAEDKFDDEIAE